MKKQQSSATCKRTPVAENGKPAGGLDTNENLRAAMDEAKGIFVIEKILHLGVMLNDNAENCGALEELIENFDETLVKDIFEDDPLRDRLLKVMDNCDDEELLQEFSWTCGKLNRLGFLCYVKAPEVTKLPKSKSRSYSFGICHCRWFYDEDLAGIIRQAGEWALSMEKEGPVGKLVEVPVGGEDDDD